MTRVIVEYIVIGLFVAVLGLAGYSVYLNQRLDHAQAQQQAATSLAKGYKVYAKAHEKVAKNKEKVNAEVREALQDHADWANEPVPTELADKLRDRDPK
ncbi:i-spanin [Xanthomonas phage Xaa_vB_phi31]|uniref:I-spanin n=1 Tax=Xanthomonas phage Xaa_vB_phi31 TaxID=2776752 RepID=A0A868C0L6_9CAUD|nr:i-spanin [Xanthomonas phage Xaa_vB_phi31]